MTGVQDSETEVQALEAIANLATVSVEDKQTIAILTAINTTLVAELAEVRKEFVAFRKSSNRRNLNYYYWSCGTYCDYNSKTYKDKKLGHKDNAT